MPGSFHLLSLVQKTLKAAVNAGSFSKKEFSQTNAHHVGQVNKRRTVRAQPRLTFFVIVIVLDLTFLLTLLTVVIVPATDSGSILNITT